MELDRYTLVLIGVGLSFTLWLLADSDHAMSRVQVAALLVWIGFGLTMLLLSREKSGS